MTAMTQEAFTRWLDDVGPYIDTHIKRYGKPRVRVPVQRQTPNEADL
jgi:hypothetical protein